jgi:tetratricopeptide (TPR) repeat protein
VQLGFLQAVDPKQPVSPEGLEELMVCATRPLRSLSPEFELLVADLFPEDFEVQKTIAKRIIFATGSPELRRDASRAFSRVVKRAVATAPNREEELAHLELLGDMLTDAYWYEDGLKLADAVLAQPDISDGLRAKCHYWRSSRLSILGRHQESLDEADKALALNNTILRCHFRRCKSLYYLKRYDPSLRAALAFVRGTDLHASRNAFNYFQESVIKAFVCSRAIAKPYAYELASEAIVALLDMKPEYTYAGWWLRLGFVQLRAGHADRAVRSLERAVDLLPLNPPNYAIRKGKLLETSRPLLEVVRRKGVKATGAYRKVINQLERVRGSKAKLP